MPRERRPHALDCALIDLEARRQGLRVWSLLGQPEPKPCVTAFTILAGLSRGHGGSDPRKPRTGGS